MAFLNERISDKTSVNGTRGGPIGSRTVTRTTSGFVFQQFNWSRALHQYDAMFGVRTEAQFEALRAFMYVVFFEGPYEGFLYKDWGDYRFTKTTSSLSFIVGVTWQMNRTYTVNAKVFLRKIVKPRANIIIYRLRGVVESVATATYDTATGIATMTAHIAGDTYYMEGEFDVPVMFKDDNAFAQIAFNNGGIELLPELGSVMLEELRL